MANLRNFQLPKSFCPPKNGDTITCEGHSYLIGSEIGKGNFGQVYECTDEWGNELVAKVNVPQNQSYDEIKKNWAEELDNLLNLRHPNITFIYNAFECNDTFYLIIERCYCDFKDAFDLPWNEREFLFPYVARDLLQAINFIHSFGYVHKDIHPGNIFLAKVQDKMIPNKEPVWMFKLGDLGISRLESDINIFNTIMAQWLLPPEYLNPEEFGRIGKQVDIYHTGLLLLSLLLGENTTFTLEEVLTGKPRQLAENLNSPYGDVIAKSLRRHVEHRTQTAIEFWRELKQVINPS